MLLNKLFTVQKNKSVEGKINTMGTLNNRNKTARHAQKNIGSTKFSGRQVEKQEGEECLCLL